MKKILSLIAVGVIAATATTALASPGEREQDGRCESESHESYERSDHDRRKYRHERRERHNARYERRLDDDSYGRSRKRSRSDD